MIALYENLNRQEVKKKKSRSSISSSINERARYNAQVLLQKLIDNREKRKQNKADKLALNQLIQLDDALLKDMGISRSELDQVRRGTLSFDALVKRQITSVRDNSGNSQPPQKIPQ